MFQSDTVNLYLHYNLENVNVGMARTKDSMPAKTIKDFIKKRLHDFGFKINNIVAAMTYGATMTKEF